MLVQWMAVQVQAYIVDVCMCTNTHACAHSSYFSKHAFIQQNIYYVMCHSARYEAYRDKTIIVPLPPIANSLEEEDILKLTTSVCSDTCCNAHI